MSFSFLGSSRISPQDASGGDGQGCAEAARPRLPEPAAWRASPAMDAGGADVDEAASFARNLARKHPGLPRPFVEAFAAQAVSLRDMGEAALRRAAAQRILSVWRLLRSEGREGAEALLSRMGLQGQRDLPEILPALPPAGRDDDDDDEAAVAALAGALSLAGTPLTGMPGEVRDRYAAVLDAAGRIDPAWGLLQAWLAQVPVSDPA